MSRLTEKNPNGKKLILKSGKVINHFSVLTESWMICDKLGKLEDLEEELNIDLLELLEDFKKTKEELKDILNEHPEITPDYMAYTLSNGITYRKLTEKLGCPLKVVFKAIEDGIVIKSVNDKFEGATLWENRPSFERALPDGDILDFEEPRLIKYINWCFSCKSGCYNGCVKGIVCDIYKTIDELIEAKKIINFADLKECAKYD